MSISVTAMRNRTIMGVEAAWKESEGNYGQIMLSKTNEIFDFMYSNILKEGESGINEFVESALKDQPKLLTMNVFPQAYHRSHSIAKSEAPQMCLCDIVHDALIAVIIQELLERGIKHEYFKMDENGNVDLKLPQTEAA